MTEAFAGAVHVHASVPSTFLPGRRETIIYLPPGYSQDNERRYPVLYLQDGQNLFNPATAFANQDWGLAGILDSLLRDELINPLIVVGVYNAGENRIAEYSHIRNRQGSGGRARRYAQFMAKDLKPYIDSGFRTLPDKNNTGLGGSSLGGLVSFYIGLHYPSIFGRLIIMSPSIWWANRAILRETRRLKGKTEQKIWLDVGTAEGDQPEVYVQDARDLRDVLVTRGWVPGTDLRFVEDEGAGHDEKAWGSRMRDALMFHFPSHPEMDLREFNLQPELHP